MRELEANSSTRFKNPICFLENVVKPVSGDMLQYLVTDDSRDRVVLKRPLIFADVTNVIDRIVVYDVDYNVGFKPRIRASSDL